MSRAEDTGVYLKDLLTWLALIFAAVQGFLLVADRYGFDFEAALTQEVVSGVPVWSLVIVGFFVATKYGVVQIKAPRRGKK